HQYTIRAARRNGLVEALKAARIGCAVYYPKPLHLQPCFAGLGYQAGDFPEAERAANEVVSLPVYPELTEAQRDEVIAAVVEFVQ
ncbi:MAG: DegT/DnrJ/EryC1/StrS family aminotransferase, partial [Gemmatimonadota bacterium]|nr:DegT/DnrJ/EryC1/StrS family aminotransferase [Gemmatimonadota bacterium]